MRTAALHGALSSLALTHARAPLQHLSAADEAWREAATAPTDVRREAVQFVTSIKKIDATLQLALDDSTKKERTAESIRNSRKLHVSHTERGESSSALERMWAETVEEFAAPTLDFRVSPSAHFRCVYSSD